MLIINQFDYKTITLIIKKKMKSCFESTRPKKLKPVYINVPHFISLSSSYQKTSICSTLKNRNNQKKVKNVKHNSIIPEISLSSYNNKSELSPHKRIHHNNSASFDKFLLLIQKKKIIKILTNKKAPASKRVLDNNNNNVIIKTELNNDSKDRDNDRGKDKEKEKESSNNHYSINSISSILSNHLSKQKPHNPFLYLDYTIMEQNITKKSTQKVASLKTPVLFQSKQAFTLKKERNNIKSNTNSNKRSTRNKKELCFPSILNSYSQIAKMNTFFLNNPDIVLNDNNHMNSHNNKRNINCITNSNWSKLNQIKISESNFNTREVDGRVNNVYRSISGGKTLQNEARSIANKTITIQNEPMNSYCSKDCYNGYHDIIWNNINSINPDIAKLHLQKKRLHYKEDDDDDDNFLNKTVKESLIFPERHYSKETTLKLPIDCHDLIKQTINTSTEVLRDSIIYNEDYFNASQNGKDNENQSHNNSSTSNEEEVEQDDYDDEIIDNDESVNEHGSNDEDVSDKMKTFKSLRCFTIKSSLSQFESSLSFIINYLNLRSISTLVQVNRYLNTQLTQILYNQIGNIILKGINRDFLSMIKPSLFRFSFIFDSHNISSIYNHNLKMKTQYSHAITKDLKRTIIDDVSFTIGNSNNRKLQNILTAYANYNNKIGYAQGMNFLVANAIYLFEKEEDVFLFIDGMINKFKLETLYGVNNTLNHLMKRLGDLIEKHVPMLVRHLNNNSLNHEFFTTNWVLTLFSNAMKTKYLFMLWDFMIVFGWRFFLYFCVEVILWNEDEIISSKVKQLSLTMKNLLRKEEFERNFPEMIGGTFVLMKKD